MKISDGNFIYLYKSILEPKGHKKRFDPLIKAIFERGNVSLDGYVVLTSELLSELKKIGQGKEPDWDPVFEVGEKIYIDIMLEEGIMYFGIAGDTAPFNAEDYGDFDEDDVEADDEEGYVDCIGDFEINLYTREVSFEVRCETS